MVLDCSCKRTLSCLLTRGITICALCDLANTVTESISITCAVHTEIMGAGSCPVVVAQKQSIGYTNQVS